MSKMRLLIGVLVFVAWFAFAILGPDWAKDVAYAGVAGLAVGWFMGRWMFERVHPQTYLIYD